MPTYLIINRLPAGYRPSPAAAGLWTAWFDELGDHLVDRGNPVFTRQSLGTESNTLLGGYTLVTAADLSAAVQLARNCPAMREGGGVEIGELTLLNAGTGPAATAPN